MTTEQAREIGRAIRKLDLKPLYDAFGKLAQACKETIKAFSDMWHSPSMEQIRLGLQVGKGLQEGIEQGIKDAQKRKPLELLHQYDPKKKKHTYRCKYKTISMLEKEWRK